MRKGREGGEEKIIIRGSGEGVRGLKPHVNLPDN